VLEDFAELEKCEHTREQCEWHKGGSFQRDVSNTWLSQTQQEFRGAEWDAQKYSIRGEDLLRAPSISIPELPLVLDDSFTPEADDRSKLGLGVGSSILNRLFQLGEIPSRSWSLDFGWSGAEEDDAWDDGNLVLGGKDRSLYTGDLYPQDFAREPDGRFDQECHLKVTITGITMSNSTSDDIDLFEEGKSEARM
jgi:hypothetical protein